MCVWGGGFSGLDEQYFLQAPRIRLMLDGTCMPLAQLNVCPRSLCMGTHTAFYGGVNPATVPP